MADILPKIKLFLFISIVSLIINLCACSVAYLQNTQTISDYVIFEDVELDTTNTNNVNVSAVNFVVASVTSFLPFVDIINLAFLGLDFLTSIFVGIIISIFGALKLLLLAEVIASHFPTVNV